MTSSRREAEGARAPRLRDLTRRQRLLLAALLLALPLLLAAVAEGALRVAGYGGEYPLFVVHPDDDAWLLPNVEVGRRYFVDPEDAPRPHMDLLEREKSPETWRVVVQGASSAAGFPYYFGGAFSRMLRQRLRETFPERRIEVVNVALDATNSYAILDLVDEIVAVEPDAVLLYAGHNEFYGTFGVASSQSVGRAPAVVRSYLVLRRLRLVQALRDVLARSRAALGGGAGPTGEGHATLMERLAGERTIRYGSPLHRAGVEQFRSNLDRILGRYRAAGIPVYVGTLASNERSLPPFVSRPAEGVDTAAWESGLRRARRALEEGDPGAALEPLDELLERDSLAPLPHFLRGRALTAAGHPARAAEPFFRARDYDQLPFRAARLLNDVARAAAARHGATVVESRERLAAESDHGVIGHELMLEHVHPRIEGQLLLADAFYRALRADGAIGEWRRTVPLDSARTRVPVTAVDTLAAGWWIERLTAGFPFASPDSPPVTVGDTLHPSDPVEAIALAMYRDALPWPEGQRRLYDHYLEVGRYGDALHVARVLADELPLWEGALLMAGRAALLMDRPDLALEAFREAHRARPTAFGTRSIGGILASRGDTAAARPYFERTVRLAGADRDASLALRAFDAIPELERASRERPHDPDVWTDLAGTYLLTAQYRRAEAAARRALETEPGHPEAVGILARLEQILSPEGTGSTGGEGSPLGTGR